MLILLLRNHIFGYLHHQLSFLEAPKTKQWAPCKRAAKGGVSETCDMKCGFSGKCSEIIKTENCGCSGKAKFSTTTNNYQVCHKTISILSNIPLSHIRFIWS